MKQDSAVKIYIAIGEFVNTKHEVILNFSHFDTIRLVIIRHDVTFVLRPVSCLHCRSDKDFNNANSRESYLKEEKITIEV
jgi:hypothetical protein